MTMLLPPRDRTGAPDDPLGLAAPGGAGAWRVGGRLALVATALVAVAIAGYALFRPATPGLGYVTEPVTRGDLHVIVTATGSVQPTSQVEISSELSGTVRRVFVDYNSAVTAGETLAELDTDKFQASVDGSRAKLAAARAKVAEAEVTVRETAREFDRKASLANTQHGSRHDLDSAQAARDRAVAALAGAQADIAAAEAELALNESNLEKTRIRSPISGIVLERAVDPGQIVASSLQAPELFTIAEDLRRMEAQVDVDEADVGRVREGQSATFTVDAYPDRRFPAVIRDVRYASETDDGVVTYKAILIVDNDELLLRPGMTATADIAVQDVTDALLIPNAALRFSPPAPRAEPSGGFLRRLLPMPPPKAASRPEAGGPDRVVWVLRDGEPAAVRVKTGPSDGRRTAIPDAEHAGGLAPGTALIVDTASGR